MKVLITGGAGFIGSTIASAAADAGHQPVVLDNLVTGRTEFTRGFPFYRGDIRDAELVATILREHPDIWCVVHCAALMNLPESVSEPIPYYDSNVAGTLALVQALLAGGVDRFIFSSSGSIYEPSSADFSVDEDSPVNPTNPYSRTKAVVEAMLSDIAHATALKALSLRYFNPIGADPELRTGLQLPEPSHALGKMVTAHRSNTPFRITGTDFPTRDGTGIRDYVHVWDLAAAHVLAIEKFDELFADESHCVINLGEGKGVTVLELVEEFRSVTDGALRVENAPRRPGDSAGAWTKSDRARELLDWTTRVTLADGIRDTLRWFEHRPEVLPDLR